MTFRSRSEKEKPWGRFALVLLYALWLLPQVCPAQKSGEAEEYQAKTALIYNFAKFVTWPQEVYADGDAPFVIATLGDNPFGTTLNLLSGKKMHGRSIEVRHFADVDAYQPCQILYCSLEDLQHLANQDSASLEYVLTIGEKEGFATGGGIVLFTFVDDHLAFKINVGAARKANLEISANLFRLAAGLIDDGDAAGLVDDSEMMGMLDL